MRLISYKMNQFLQRIHHNELIVYINMNQFYVIDNGIYILKGLLKFHYRIRNGRRVILISNKYLKYCLEQITNRLSKIGLQVNKKTKIYKSSENINFIGVRKNRRYSNIARTRKKYKKMLYDYEHGYATLNSLISSKQNYLNRKRGVKV